MGTSTAEVSAVADGEALSAVIFPVSCSFPGVDMVASDVGLSPESCTSEPFEAAVASRGL